jgi:NADH-quinone oxidoreductase subunit L
LWLIGVAAAGMTAFYMGRQVFMTFFGRFRGGESMRPHLQESPGVMTWPLVALAAGSIFAGGVGVPHAFGGSNRIESFLEPAIWAGTHLRLAEAHHGSAGTEILFALFSVAVAGFGLFLAYHLVVQKPGRLNQMAKTWAGVHRVLANKYWLDEIYDATVVRLMLGSARGLFGFDVRVVDGAVNGAARSTRLTALLSNLADINLVDGAVHLTGAVLAGLSGTFRRLQTGLVQNYALLMLVGIFLLAALFYFWI